MTEKEILELNIKARFMATAPFPVPEWFQPTMASRCPDGLVTPKQTEWHREKSKQTMIQWPRAWAELQYQQLQKESSHGNCN